MTNANDPELFRRIASDRGLEAWIEAKRTEALRHLAEGTDAVGIYRAQARYRLLNEMTELLAKAKDLR